MDGGDPGHTLDTTSAPAPRLAHITAEVTAVRRGALIILAGRQAGLTFPVDGTVTIGRSSDCTISLNSTRISREHLRVSCVGDGVFELEDLDSRNGIEVNGVPQKQAILEFGDRINVAGETLLMLTPHDQLQEKLLHNQRMQAVGRLAAGIAHDLNNFLGAALCNVDLLRDDPGPGEDSVEMLKDVDSACRRAADLVRQLLVFAQRGDFRPESLDLNSVVEEVQRLCIRLVHPSIQIACHPDAELNVRGDRAQLSQVVMNLVVNARDALESGGQISITTKDDGEDVVLCISDNGPGMTEEVKSRIFEPFFTTKTLGRGTGLGLATVQGIVAQHGGTVSVESAVNRGTTFVVRLPGTAAEDDFGMATKPIPAANPDRAPRRVLVVDDNELNLRGTARCLRKLGYEPVLARNGLEAVQILAEQGSDVSAVVLDWLMPKLDGAATSVALRRIREDIPILAVSGFASSRQSATDCRGVQGFLSKPFTADVLDQGLRQVVTVSSL